MMSLLKNLILAVSLALILWLGYSVFFAEDDVTLGEEVVAGQAAIEGQEFLMKLQALRELNLDGSVFSDPRFQTLIDHRQSLVEEPYGRTNPFSSTGF